MKVYYQKGKGHLALKRPLPMHDRPAFGVASTFDPVEGCICS
jgi:hypothetical protein